MSGVRVRPDIVFSSARVAVFVDGCFWHQCPEHGRRPTSNEAYWTPKLARNQARDRLGDDAFLASGWTVVRVWEHEDIDDAVEKIMSKVRPAATSP